MLFYLWGMSTAMYDSLHREQFELMRKEVDLNDYVMLGAVISAAIGIVIYAYRTGEIETTLLSFLILVIGFGGLYRLPAWKYIENRVPVGAVVLSLLMFSIHLGISIKRELDDIKHDAYKSAYILTLKSNYHAYVNYSFLTRNSSFTFLLDNSKNTAVVIPNGAVEAFQPR